MSLPGPSVQLSLDEDATFCLRGWWPWQEPWWSAASSSPAPSRAGTRRRCARLLRQYEVPKPFDVRKFAEGLERQRGRRIMLVPVQTASRSPCGLWFSTDACDYVFFEGATSPLHQVHIILHELGHMLCGHDGVNPFGEEFLRKAMPNIDPAAVRRVLGRTAFSADDEREAEVFATLVGERGEITDVAHAPLELPPDTALMLSRLAAGLAEARDAR